MALEQNGLTGDLCMENRYDPGYSALFLSGKDLVLAVVDNTKKSQIQVGLKKFCEMP